MRRAIAAVWLAAFAAGSLDAKQRVVVVNEDNDHYFKQDASLMTEAALSAYVDRLAGGKVTHFFMCPSGQRTSYDSKAWEPIWKGLDEPNGLKRGLWTRWAQNAKLLADKGVDPYLVWIRRCREKGISPWLTPRMNDVHGAGEAWPFRSTTFWRTRKDLRCEPDYTGRDGGRAALDFSHDEVQDYTFALVREQLDRYDIDGYELDFFRFADYFRRDRAAASSHHLDRFVKRVKDYVDAKARERGHPIALGVRVATTPEAARAKGCDVGTWVRNGWVTWVTASTFWETPDLNVPVAAWRAWFGDKAESVMLLVGTDYGMNSTPRGGFRLDMTPESYAGFADVQWGLGADGVYLFNIPYLTATLASVCRKGLFPADLAGQRRRYPVSFRAEAWGGASDDVQLPRPSDRENTFRVRLGARPSGQVSVLVGVKEPGDFAPKVTLNGVEAVASRAESLHVTGFDWPDLHEDYWCRRYDFPATAAHPGNDNVVRVAASQPRKTLIWCEVDLDPGRAVRAAKVDAAGVMRWEDGGEVSLWGVNYYTPFTVDHAAMKARGLDHKAEILKDLEHFRRLGLTSVRIHCFDRQFSGPNGELVDNEHVELLDYLIAQAAKRGIYTVLTPIAWWGGLYAPEKDGFSNRWTMRELTTVREAWTCQAAFLKAFGEHVNRFTGRRYADDPAIVAYELVNEPLYPPDTPDETVIAYANALADGLRASGTKKPVFYNSWQGRNGALSRARVDGVTGSVYPTGLVAGHALVGPQLAKVRASSLAPVSAITNRARMIYEFDAADTPGTYMYPALARLFRSEGVQVANMFQYDPLAVAPYNRGWQTHFLNLVYAPGKALSFAIAGEGFRAWKRGCGYESDAHRHSWTPYRVDADEDLSELVTEWSMLYSNDTATQPPHPDRLTRVWGCGVSPVAASRGTGAYFLDRLAGGVWNAQLYPSVATVRDVYSGGDALKVAASLDPFAFTAHLPDLDEAFSVWCNGVFVGRARAGTIRLEPGEYVFVRGDRLPRDWRLLRETRGLPDYVAPKGDGHWTPPKTCTRPQDWNFFDVDRAMRTWLRGAWRERTQDDAGRPAYKNWMHGGFTAQTECAHFRVDADGRELLKRIPDCRDTDACELVFHMRALIPETTQLEIAVYDEDGLPWGAIVPIKPQWQDVRVPLKSLRHFSHWMNGVKPPAGAKPDLARMRSLNFCYGTWLFPRTSRLEHGFEISSVTVDWPRPAK